MRRGGEIGERHGVKVSKGLAVFRFAGGEQGGQGATPRAVSDADTSIVSEIPIFRKALLLMREAGGTRSHPAALRASTPGLPP
jgi:hypothetical protein